MRARMLFAALDTTSIPLFALLLQDSKGIGEQERHELSHLEQVLHVSHEQVLHVSHKLSHLEHEPHVSDDVAGQERQVQHELHHLHLVRFVGSAGDSCGSVVLAQAL